MSYRVNVHPSDHTFFAEPSETLLEAGLRAGLNLDHSCANGSCGECRARLRWGKILPAAHADYRFSEREKQQGWFLMCSCRPAGDVVIEAHETGSAAEIPQQQVAAKAVGSNSRTMSRIVQRPRSVAVFAGDRVICCSMHAGRDAADRQLPVRQRALRFRWRRNDLFMVSFDALRRCRCRVARPVRRFLQRRFRPGRWCSLPGSRVSPATDRPRHPEGRESIGSTTGWRPFRAT